MKHRHNISDAVSSLFCPDNDDYAVSSEMSELDTVLVELVY